MLKTYTGSCHCGAVRFEADLDITQPTYRCNCSICRRTRFWAAVVAPSGFRLLQGREDLTKYLFNTRRNEHFFCRHCGVRAFGHGTDTPMGEMYGINVGCIDGLSDEELSRIPIVYVNGGDEDWQNPPRYFSHL
jgi:hypothetical protein